jgi:hypothetical protein
MQQEVHVSSAPSPFHLEELYFPVQELRALPAHDANGNRQGTNIPLSKAVQPVADAGQAYWFTLTVVSNDATSVNAAYSFRVEAAALFRCTEAMPTSADRMRALEAVALPAVLGAVRERIAEMSSRAPWGRYLVNLLPGDADFEFDPPRAAIGVVPADLS